MFDVSREDETEVQVCLRSEWAGQVRRIKTCKLPPKTECCNEYSERHPTTVTGRTEVQQMIKMREACSVKGIMASRCVLLWCQSLLRLANVESTTFLIPSIEIQKCNAETNDAQRRDHES